MIPNPKIIFFLFYTITNFLFLYNQTDLALESTKERPWEKFLAKGKKLNIKYPKINRLLINEQIELFYLQANVIPKVYFKIYIEGGLIEETSDKLGLTKIWGESVTYSGSKEYDRDKLSAILEENTSSFNFSQDIERASFSLISLSDFFESDLKIVLEVMNHPRFDIQDMRLLQKQAIQKLKEARKNPASLAYLGASHSYWKGHLRDKQYTIKTLSAITRDDLLKKQAEMWKTNRVRILVAGDFDLAELKKILTENMPPVNLKRLDFNSVLEVPEDILKTKLDRSYHIVKDIPQSVVLWKGKGIEHHSQDYFAWKIFDFILGGDSFNSYLTQEIRVKRGWVYSIYSTYNTDKFHGSITIFAQSQNKNTIKLIQKVEDILKTPEKFISPDRIEQAKKSIRNKFVFLYSTYYDFLIRTDKLRSHGLNQDYLKTFLSNIEKTSYDEVIRVAKKYYRPSELFKIIVGPDDLRISGRKNILKLPK